MLKLIEVNEHNWLDVRRLAVDEAQERFLDSPTGILARGYAYRASRARVIAIADGDTVVGTALVKDLDEEPACYDLQQFLIDRRYQNRGLGTEALGLILSDLAAEGKYDCAEVCVHADNGAALRVYEKVGFVDTLYVDPDAPDCRNLRFRFRQGPCAFTDELISDFTDSRFRQGFRRYFAELGITVRDWDRTFRHMDEDGGNLAYIRTDGDGGLVGFIQFKPIPFTSWFFEETCGFIREFWVAEAHRRGGHGAALLALAEDYFRSHGMYTSILTTDTAADFYRKHGYEPASACRARNEDPVFVKRLDRP